MITREEVRPPEAVGEASMLVIEPVAESVRAARGFVGRWFEHHGMDAAGHDAITVVSELVTNAVRHACPAGQKITLRVYRSERGAVIEVLDPSPEPPVIKPFDLNSEDGRGLAMVSLLAARWGAYTRRAGGKAVWAVIA